MAKKSSSKKKPVNIKFLAVTGAIVVLGGGLVGGFAYLQITRAPQRNIALGDQLMQEGKYELAMERYGRAVRKSPNDASYLAKMESALLKIQPDSQTRSSQLFGQWLQILSQSARVTDGGRNPAAWRRFTDMLLTVGEAKGLQDAAELMQSKFPEDDAAAQLEIRRLKAIASAFQAVSNQSGQAATESLIPELKSILDADPTDARTAGWLLRVLVAEADRARTSGVASRQRSTRERLDAEVEKIAQQQPENPMAPAVRLLTLIEDGRSGVDNQGAVDAAGMALVDTVTRAVQTGGFEVAGMTLADFRTVQDSLRRVGTPEASAALLVYLEKGGEVAGNNAAELELARAEFSSNPESAATRLRKLLDAPRPEVGMDALADTGLRREAAELLARVTLSRYADAKGGDAAAAATILADLQAQIAALKSDPEGNPDLAEVGQSTDVILASIDGNHARVLELGLPLVNRPTQPSAEAAYHIGQAYIARDEAGEALQVVERALRSHPTNGNLMLLQAQALGALGRYRQAEAVIQRLARDLPGDPRVAQVADAVRRSVEQGVSPLEAATDPVILAMNRLIELEASGDRAGALSAAAELSRQNPNDRRVALYRAQLLVRAGQRDRALEVFDAYLSANPNEAGAESIRAAIREEDPVKRLDAVLAAEGVTGDDLPLKRIPLLTVELERVNTALAAATREEDRARLRTQADALTEARQESLAQLKTRGLKSEIALEMRFVNALDQKDDAELDAILEEANSSPNKFLANLLKGRRAMAKQDWVGAIAAFEAVAADPTAPLAATNRLANAYLSAGRVDQAQRLLAESYRRRPTDVEVARMYAVILQRVGRQQEALEVLRAGAQANQREPELRNAWLTAEGLYGDKGRVVLTRRQIMRNVPGDLENIRQLASLLCVTPARADLAIDDRGNPRLPAAVWNAMDNRAQAQELRRIRSELIAEAQTLTQRLLAFNPDDFNAVASLVVGLNRSGEVDRAARVMEDAAKKASPAVAAQMLLAAAEAQGALGNESEFERLLGEARAKAGNGNRLFDLVEGRLLGQRGRIDAAHEALRRAGTACEAALAADPKDARAASELDAVLREQFVLYGRQRDLAGMQGVLDRMKALEPADASASQKANRVRREIDAAVILADDQFARGDAEGQRTSLARIQALTDEAIRLEPRDAHPLIVRAQLGRRTYSRTADRKHLDDALVAIEEANRIAPGSWPISGEAVRVYIARDEFAKAAETLQNHLKLDPESQPARERLAGVYRLSGKPDAAVAVWDDAIKADALRVDYHRAKGSLLLLLGRDAEAGASFEEAYQLGGRLDDLVKSVRSRLAADPVEANAILSILSGREQELAGNLLLRSARATARYHSGMRQDALLALRDIWRQNNAAGSARQADSYWFSALNATFPPDKTADLEAFVLDTVGTPSADVATELSQSWLRSPQGAAKGMEWAKLALQDTNLTPLKRASVHSLVGQSYGYENKWEESAQAFEQAVKEFPRNPGALNNLAFIQATHLNQPTAAVEHARRALEIAGGVNAELLDTLGVALLAAGQLDEASTRLEQAAELGPTASIFLHQAQVAKARGQTDEARAAARRARELATSDESRAEIDALISTLPPSGGTGGTP